MDDYIRRGAAIEQFEDSTSAIPEKLARIRIEEVPAADVVEVRHGMWLRTPTGWVYCSVCGEEPPEETNARTKYCPNCGAKNGGHDDE